MLRFINLTGQITEGDHEFAWYDTIIDKFLEFNGIQTWSTWEDFEQDYDGDDIKRFKGLFGGIYKCIDLN